MASGRRSIAVSLRRAGLRAGGDQGVLTGNLDDGVAGLWTIKRLGGVAVVRDPDDALFPSMPLAAD